MASATYCLSVEAGRLSRTPNAIGVSQHSDRLQVFEPIARLRHQHRVAEKRAVADQHGVSVRRRLRHRGCGDGAARTGPGFDDAGLAPGVGQLLANDPHHGVVVPARRRRNHELDDLRREGLRLRLRARQNARTERARAAASVWRRVNFIAMSPCVMDLAAIRFVEIIGSTID